MSKVIIVSRNFPAYHPRKGESTDFVFKIWKGIMNMGMEVPSVFIENYVSKLKCDMPSFSNIEPKHHTIRAGNRWKVGDKASLRVWSGKPYNSKQITIAPDIEIKKVYDVEISGSMLRKTVGIIHKFSKYRTLVPLADVAMNDGLSNYDFIEWFPKDFIGQIICWNGNTNY